MMTFWISTFDEKIDSGNLAPHTLFIGAIVLSVTSVLKEKDLRP